VGRAQMIFGVTCADRNCSADFDSRDRGVQHRDIRSDVFRKLLQPLLIG